MSTATLDKPDVPDTSGHEHDDHHDHDRPFQFGVIEGGTTMSALISDYHNRFNADGDFFKRFLVLGPALWHTSMDFWGHLAGEWSSNERDKALPATLKSATGLALGSTPVAGAYLFSGTPAASTPVAAAAAATAGAKGALDDEREEGRTWRDVWKQKLFRSKLCTKLGVQAGATLSASGIGAYAGMTAAQMEKGASFSSAASHLDGVGFVGAGVASILASLGLRKWLRKHSSQEEREQPLPWDHKQTTREWSMGAQEGAQLGGVNAVINAGLGMAPAVAIPLTLFQSVANGITHASGSAAANGFKQRSKAFFSAFGGVLSGSVMPLAGYIAGGVTGALGGSAATAAGIGIWRQWRDARRNRTPMQWKKALSEVRTQLEATLPGIGAAYIGASAISGGLGAVNPLVWAAGGSYLALKATQFVRKRYKNREEQKLQYGARAWDRMRRRVDKWHRKADKYRSVMELDAEWEKHSEQLRSTYTLTTAPEEYKKPHTSHKRKPSSAVAWHKYGCRLTRLEQKIARSLHRMEGVQQWDEHHTTLQKLHMRPAPFSAPSPQHNGTKKPGGAKIRA